MAFVAIGLILRDDEILTIARVIDDTEMPMEDLYLHLLVEGNEDVPFGKERVDHLDKLFLVDEGTKVVEVPIEAIDITPRRVWTCPQCSQSKKLSYEELTKRVIDELGPPTCDGATNATMEHPLRHDTVTVMELQEE